MYVLSHNVLYGKDDKFAKGGFFCVKPSLKRHDYQYEDGHPLYIEDAHIHTDKRCCDVLSMFVLSKCQFGNLFGAPDALTHLDACNLLLIFVL